MRYFKYNLISYIILILIFTSCKKILNPSPVSTISSESFWHTEDDARGALNGMYARFRQVTSNNLILWGEARSQDMVQAVGNHFSTLRIFQNTIDPTEAGPDWTVLYRVIGDANLILKNVPDINFKDESEKNSVLAQAFTMRAFCYFVLVKTWGDVPLVDEPTQGFDQEKLFRERSSVGDIFSFIKSDIDSALSKFSNYNFPAGRGEWSKPGALTLKADVYIWTGKLVDKDPHDFELAIEALDSVSTYSDVELLNNFSDVFAYSNKGNNEIIMANTFQRQESTGGGAGLDPTAAGGANGLFIQNMRFDQYPPNPDPVAAEKIGVTSVGAGAYYKLSDKVRNSFSPDDQRKDASFISLYYLDVTTGQYSIFYSDIEMKFQGTIENGLRYLLDDVVIYRYADVLLLKAEAENALGLDPSAEINLIRKRAFQDKFQPDHIFINSNQEENDSLILDERQLEFLYEGKMWWDILRFGKAEELIPYFHDHPDQKYRYLWPISLNVLSLEPKVAQNPGY